MSNDESRVLSALCYLLPMVLREIPKSIRRVELRASFLTVALLSTVSVFGCGEAKEAEQNSQMLTSLVGKSVTFDVPKAWVLQKHATNVDSESFQYLIPDAATDDTSDSANAGIFIEAAGDGLNVTNFSNLRLGSTPNPDGDTVMTKIFANDKWCSAISRGQQDQTPYIIMDRFGLDQGVSVMFRLAQPVLTNRPVIAESISNFNAVVDSLKIGGTNAVNSEMRQDRGTIWLRAFSDMDTNWMTNKVTIRSPLPRK
jgi:hypothetical protein